MRCHKARLKLCGPDRSDPELIEHLRSCPACSRLASADEVLSGALRSAEARADHPPTPLPVLQARLAARLTKKELSVMAKLTDLLTGHRRMGYVLGAGMLALLFFVLVPIPYQRTTGYDISMSGISDDISVEQVMAALKAIGFDRLSINVNGTPVGNDYVISGLPSRQAAREAGAALVALTGAKTRPVITPIIETVSGSLYAQARERLIKIEVDGTGKTDDQIKAEIESKLAAQGFSGGVVFVKTEDDGERHIKLEIAESGDGPRTPQETIEIDGRGKTPAQIQDEIKSRLAQEGRPNANVTVLREGPDSLRQIRIEIEDTVRQ